MKNLDVIRLYNVLSALRVRADAEGTSNFSGKFAVLANYNRKALQPQAETIQEALQGPWTQVIQTYEQEELKLISLHAGRADGAVARPNVHYAINDMKAFEIARLELRAKHDGLDEAFAAQGTANAVLEQESPNIALQKIRLEDLPNNITLDQGDALQVMVDLPALVEKAAS